MLVYGDHERIEETHVVHARLAGALTSLTSRPAGIERHGALVSVFVGAAELAQGLADASFEAAGEDDPTPADDAAMALLMALAGTVAASWDSGFQRLAPVPGAIVPAMMEQPLPHRIRMRQAEGHAFYALYPEAYLEAARRLPGSSGPAKVIGLRSIGTGLAAMAALALNAAPPVTLRPVGHPFRRELRVSPRLAAALTADPEALFVVVDEGPGLSGSSFGVVADWLEERGVPRGRIVFLPGHGGDLGPHASPEHRRRWAAASRPVVTFDALLRPAEAPVRPATPRSPERPPLERPPLERWFEDCLGPAVAPLQDLSGGAWRVLSNSGSDGGSDGGSAAWSPSHPQQERRKFLLRTASGSWLLKFAGLGDRGDIKLERARLLHGAGFSAEPMALRHGVLAERWLEGARPMSATTPDLIARLADYLVVRARNFPAPRGSGADLPDLLAMAEVNVAEALGEPAALPLKRWTADILTRLDSAAHRIVTDNRLHLWEWLRTPDGRLVKTDALDHAGAHDRIGCQDVAWDVAGGIVELGLSAREAGWLCDTVGGHVPLDRRLVGFCIDCYIAFQIGYWTFAAPFDGAAASAASRYKTLWNLRPSAMIDMPQE